MLSANRYSGCEPIAGPCRTPAVEGDLPLPKLSYGAILASKTIGIRRMLTETDSPSVGERPRGSNRRKFLGQVGAAATFAAGALAIPSVSSAQAVGSSSNSPGGVAPLLPV